MYLADIIAAFWSITTFLGFIAFVVFERQSTNSFYGLTVVDGYYKMSFAAHVIAIISIVVGARLAYAWRSKRPGRCALALAFRPVGDENTAKSLAYLLLGTTAMCAISAFAGIGASDLFRRTYYIPDDGTALATLGTIGCALTFLIGGILARSSVLRWQVLALSCVLVTEVIAIALATRIAAIGTLIFGFSLAPMLMKRSKALGVGVAVASAIVGFIVLHLTLYGRNFGEYGLAQVFQNPDAFEALIDNDFQGVWNIVMNLTFSVPVTQATIETTFHPFSYLMIEINPLPGGMAGWPAIEKSRMLSEVVPFSAMGELYAYSPFILIAYMLCAGFALQVVEQLAGRLHQLRRLFVLIFIGASMLFAMYALQYSVRNTSRLLYYAVALSLVCWTAEWWMGVPGQRRPLAPRMAPQKGMLAARGRALQTLHGRPVIGPPPGGPVRPGAKLGPGVQRPVAARRSAPRFRHQGR